MRNRTTTLFAALGLVFASISGYANAADEINPFQSPRPEVAPPVQNQAPTDLDSFEFNGIMTIGGKTKISVYDAKENKNYWLATGENGEQGLTLRRFDEKNRTVVIGRNGVVKTLSLKKAEIVPLRIASAPASNQAPQPGSVAASPPAQPASVETDEQVRERMQRVAEEIRRRRAERRKLLEERRGATN